MLWCFAADVGEGRLLVCCSNAPRGQVCLARWSLLLEATIPDGPQIEVSQAYLPQNNAAAMHCATQLPAAASVLWPLHGSASVGTSAVSISGGQ